MSSSFSFELLSQEGNPVDAFQSTLLPDLLAAQGVHLDQLFPAPEAGAVPNWRADDVILALQQAKHNLEATLQPQTTTEPVEQDMALVEMTPQQIAIMQQGSAQHYTRNEQARVKFTAQVLRAEPITNPGYDELVHCIELLQRGRSGACLLLTTAL